MNYILNPCTDAHWNMALDQYMLDEFPFTEPVFWLWQNAPSVIIGRNQSAYAEVNLPYLREQGIELARRTTGGGAVYHDLGNLNYSFAGPLQQMEEAFSWMPEALQRLGVPVTRSGRNDLLLDGRKCSGYAKRLTRDRMMVHGTLMWEVDLDRLTQALAVPGSKLQAAGVESVRSRVVNLREWLPQYASLTEFRDALQALLSGGDSVLTLSKEKLDAVNELADSRFRSWEWNFGLSPATDFHCVKRFACGTVGVRYSLRHGRLESLRFEGDFLGNLPAEELAEALLGKRLEDLGDVAADAYFDGLSSLEFASLFQG